MDASCQGNAPHAQKSKKSDIKEDRFQSSSPAADDPTPDPTGRSVSEAKKETREDELRPNDTAAEIHPGAGHLGLLAAKVIPAVSSWTGTERAR